jgi:hypothetical protein
MFGRRELKRLELRRRELVLQSTLNRLAVRVELQNIQTALLPAERIVSAVRAARPWLLLLAPLAGIFAARRVRSGGSIFAKAISALKWIQPLLVLWRQFQPGAGGAVRETSGATTKP